jgi:hypothetical protein
MSESIDATVVAQSELTKREWMSRVEERFWPRGFSRDIWMVVDAARDRRIHPMLKEFHLEYFCLYSGSLPPALEAAAPYLVQLDSDDPEAHRFLQVAWGDSWGIFLKCAAHANTLRRHLREFLVVRDPAGNRLVFRYYDPRVLRVYLPTCTADELRTFFGPIDRVWMEGDDRRILLEYGLHQSRLIETKFSLDRAEPDSAD